MTSLFTIKRDDRGYKIHITPNQLKRFGLRLGDKIRMEVEKVRENGRKRR